MDDKLQRDLPSVPLLRAIIERVIAAWHAAEPEPAEWPDAERLLEALPDEAGGGAPAWAGLVRRLQMINTFQWHEEDRSRAHGAGDALLGRVKRSIDASNRRRVQTIDALDTHLFEVFAAAGVADRGAVLPSETPGSIIDRLTVLALKRHHLAEDLAGADPASRQAGPGRLASVTEQFEDLAGCLERLLADIRAGRARLKLYRQVKIYRDEATGGLRDDLR